jgi:hypothetical protein
MATRFLLGQVEVWNWEIENRGGWTTSIPLAVPLNVEALALTTWSASLVLGWGWCQLL